MGVFSGGFEGFVVVVIVDHFVGGRGGGDGLEEGAYAGRGMAGVVEHIDLARQGLEFLGQWAGRDTREFWRGGVRGGDTVRVRMAQFDIRHGGHGGGELAAGGMTSTGAIEAGSAWTAEEALLVHCDSGSMYRRERGVGVGGVVNNGGK